MGCAQSSSHDASPTGKANAAVVVAVSSSDEASSPTKGRRRSYAGGPGGTKGVVTPTEDAKRRRLSVTVTTAEAVRQLQQQAAATTTTTLDLTAIDSTPRPGGATTGCPAADVDNPDMQGGNEPTQRTGCGVGLPIVWCEYSRPGNDPMKRAKENQDTCVVLDGFGGRRDALVAMVCDGHGPAGAHAAAFVRDRLPKAWAEAPSQLWPDPLGSLARGCVAVNGELNTSEVDVYLSGCTCVAALLLGARLIVSNVGDSRAVLGRRSAESPSGYLALDLSIDHKPDRPDERQRIVACGGRVMEWGVPRVWLADEDLPGLAMSRSFGDVVAESVGVYAEPELSEVTLGASDRFIIIASDGVFEFISSDEAVDIVAPFVPPPQPPSAVSSTAAGKGRPSATTGRTPREGRRPSLSSLNGSGGNNNSSAAQSAAAAAARNAAAALCAEAVARWQREEEVVDDITAVVLFLTGNG